MNPPALNRRQFIERSSAAAAGLWMGRSLLCRGAEVADPWNPSRPIARQTSALRVQPVLMYRLPVKKDEASWKSWGGIQDAPAVQAECERITQELNSLVRKAEFPIKVLPLATATTTAEAVRAQETDYDVLLLYACTGGGDLLKACFSPAKDTLVFVRHRSGPVYYWYEALSVRLLKTATADGHQGPQTGPENVHVDDVVVDDANELLWRLRALHAVRNTLGSRIIALGGPWGKYSPEAPAVARDRFKMNIIDVSYDDFAKRLEAAKAKPNLQSAVEQWTRRYLEIPGTVLKTDRSFVVNAFLLYHLFKELMIEHQAAVFTIKSCMGTIIPMSKTTACLSLSLLNDEGRMAFCESDFVVIPAGILLHYLSSKPVFLHNSTFPHQRMATCAHCTAPRRMDGNAYEPTQVVTHYESDYGAAPKVDMKVGQTVTFLDPEYSIGRWIGFEGTIKDNPFLDMCRTQQEVEIHGQWRKLTREVRDSHWLMVYGSYLRECQYATRKLGLAWMDLNESQI
jgi:hypothetical protein